MSARNDWLDDAVVRDRLAAAEELIAQAASSGRPSSAPLRQLRSGSTPPSAPLHAQALARKSKRLRPALLLLASRFGDAKNPEALVKGAAAIELVHEATLYHDDIVDRSATRRGSVSTVGAFGPVTAAFAGSELLYSGISLCTDMPDQVRAQIARTAATLCQGQIREVEGTGDLEQSVRTRVEIMIQKTASLFRLAARMGVLLSGVPAPIGRRLERFAVRFGLCFQLADDLGDLAKTEAALGKSPRQDLRSGVYTLPILLALQVDREASGRLAQALHTLRESGEDPLAERAIEITRRLGGLALAQALLDTWVARTRAELRDLPATRGQQARRSLDALLALVEVGARPQEAQPNDGAASVH